MHNQRGGYLNPVNDYNYLERKCEQLDKEIDLLAGRQAGLPALRVNRRKNKNCGE